MSIRSTIILLAVPLFIMLALVNGALLYFQERSEMERALNEQTLAAAVTAAEFIKDMNDPRAQLAEPVRSAAIAAAVKRVEGLDGLVLVEEGKEPIVLAAPEGKWDLAGIAAPDRTTTSGPTAGEDGKRRTTSLVPAGEGRFIAARIDAEPIFARVAEIQRDIMVIVALAAVLAALLGWFVARRITGELRANGEALETIVADKALPGASNLRIREAQDLADAVRLMESSRSAADLRSKRVMTRRDRDRSEATALVQTRDSVFAPRMLDTANGTAAARLCGDVPLGSFFALARTGSGGVAVVGRCVADSPFDSLATAVAASRFFERNIEEIGLDGCVAIAREAYAIEAIETLSWGEGDAAKGQVVCLADPTDAGEAIRFAEKYGTRDTAELLEDLDVLLSPTGVFVALGDTVSGQGVAGAGDVVLDDENAAEAADVKDFAH